jgi:hypothetical protein
MRLPWVIDLFHVLRPVFDALQEMRISHRRNAINEETDARENAKPDDRDYIAPSLKMEIPAGSYPSRAGICSSSRPRNGRSLKSCVQKYFSVNTPI